MKSLTTRILTAFILLTSCTNETPLPYVVMVSLDGFRWDYMEYAETPNLDHMAASGIKANALIPSFPTKTFPNHYTIATGLYPDHHGIVHNTFYDPNLERIYRVSDRSAVEDGTFYGGEPIWVTAEKQGMTSASFFWVGSEAPIQGIRPAYWKKYVHEFPYEQRIDTVIHWLSLPEENRPHLLLLYFDEPDGTGHDFGPMSEETSGKVEYLDSLLGDLLRKVEALPFADDVNIIVTSDHGMGPIQVERTIYLDEYLDEDWFEMVVGSHPIFNLLAKKEYYDTAWQALCKIPHVQVWKHGELPERLHYGTIERTLDFIMVADSSWQICKGNRKPSSGGSHGFDNKNRDMHTIFYAKGPSFTIDPEYPTFYNVDIYLLLATVLGLDPAPTDGDPDRIQNMIINN